MNAEPGDWVNGISLFDQSAWLEVEGDYAEEDLTSAAAGK